MATTHGKGKAHVAQANKPDAPSLGAKGNVKVGSNVPYTPKSAGKMADVSKVTLGTTHGNHNVAHPVNGK